MTVTASDGTATAVATVTISITDVAEPPDAPTTISVSAVAGSTTSLTVSWTAPANAGRPDIDNYDVQYRVSGATAWTDGPQNVTTTTANVTSLVADTLYEVQVRATNAEGDSGWSDPPVSGRTNAPPNTAPTSADEHVEADEDTDYTFSSADFLFTDTAGDSLASIKIVTLPASGTGTLTLSGTTIGSGDLPKTVLAAEIDELKYSPPANLYGTDVATFTFKVNDGTDDSADAYTMTIGVTAVNPATGAPAISGAAAVGQALTASTSGIEDVDGLTGASFTYQWVRVDADGTSNEEDISVATSASYTLVGADVGKRVRVRVTFNDDAGNAEGPLTSEAFPSSGTVGSANALTIRRLGGGSAGVCALLDIRPNPPVGGVFCLGVWFNGADPAGFTESDLEIENGTVVNFQYRGSTNMVQRITVNVAGDMGKEFVFRNRAERARCGQCGGCL